MEKIWKFLKNEDGIETAEYAVMGALVVVIVATIALTLGNAIVAAFQDIIDAIN